MNGARGGGGEEGRRGDGGEGRGGGWGEKGDGRKGGMGEKAGWGRVNRPATDRGKDFPNQQGRQLCVC